MQIDNNNQVDTQEVFGDGYLLQKIDTSLSNQEYV
jgi:hypothetical protein